jgi:hypothetical protein
MAPFPSKLAAKVELFFLSYFILKRPNRRVKRRISIMHKTSEQKSKLKRVKFVSEFNIFGLSYTLNLNTHKFIKISDPFFFLSQLHFKPRCLSAWEDAKSNILEPKGGTKGWQAGARALAKHPCKIL